MAWQKKQIGGRISVPFVLLLERTPYPSNPQTDSVWNAFDLQWQRIRRRPSHWRQQHVFSLQQSTKNYPTSSLLQWSPRGHHLLQSLSLSGSTPHQRSSSAAAGFLPWLSWLFCTDVAPSRHDGTNAVPSSIPPYPSQCHEPTSQWSLRWDSCPISLEFTWTSQRRNLMIIELFSTMLCSNKLYITCIIFQSLTGAL